MNNIEKLQQRLDRQESDAHCNALIKACRVWRKTATISICATLAVIAVAISSHIDMPLERSGIQLPQISTDAVHVYGEPKFIGCPNLMYRVQEPTPTIAVDTLWNDTMEKIKVDMDPHSYQRDHHASINWHSDFEKPNATELSRVREFLKQEDRSVAVR